jgi:hypothetical protein
MQSRRPKIGKRGITGIEIAIIGAIAVIGMFLSAVIPIFVMKTHLSRVLEIQYGYYDAGASLIGLLSDDEIYNGLSLYVSGIEDNADAVFEREAFENQLKFRLDNLVTSQCYELSYSGGTIVSNGDCLTRYSVTADIVLPDGSKETITLTTPLGTATDASEEPQYGMTPIPTILPQRPK